MSKLIVEMEMPRDCPMCPMAHYNKLNEFTGCDAVSGKKFIPRDDLSFWKSGSRPSWCPIVGVLPEQHGRLIDSDAFISTIRPLCEEDKFTACTFETVKRLMVEHINNAPTIVPADTAEKSETNGNAD